MRLLFMGLQKMRTASRCLPIDETASLPRRASEYVGEVDVGVGTKKSTVICKVSVPEKYRTLVQTPE